MKKKFLNIILCVLVCVVMLTLVGCENINKENNSLIVDKIEEKGVRLSVQRNALNTNITVTATVTPSNATNKKLNWSLEYQNNKEWDSPLYLDLSDDTLSCIIVFVEPFDVPINLNVSSQADSTIQATCQIDCYERVVSIDGIDILLNINSTTTNISLVDETYDTYDFSMLTYDDVMSLDTIITLSNINYTTTGTIDLTDNSTYSVRFCDEVLARARELYGSISNLFSSDTFTITDNSFNIKLLLKDYALYETHASEVIDVLQQCSNWFVVEVNVNTSNESNFINHSSQTFVLGGFDISDITLTNIYLNKTSVIL